MTVRTLACLVAALLAAAAVAPAFASAQTGAEEEYQLSPNIPNPGGGNGEGQNLPSGGDQPADTGTPAPIEPAAPSAPEATAATGSNGGGGNGKGQPDKGSAQAGATPTKAPAASSEVPAVGTSSSDDGGAPVLLILLAAIAAVCTGVALWRMRRDASTGGRSRGAEPTTGAASESQSI